MTPATHNALGQRAAKVVNGEVVEHYLWQDLTTLLATYDSGGNLKQRFEYTVGHTPTSFTQGGQKYYVQSDHLGSPRVITDSSGQVIKTLRYDSYGNITEDSNPAFEIPFGFAGGLYDSDTKLIRFGYRDYDPETGRWTARDPIGFAGGDSNLYGYVLDDPVNFIDPTGNILFNAGGALAGAIIGAVVGAVNATISGEEILSGALQGAAVGTTAGFTFGGSLVASVAGNAAVSAAAEAARQQLTTGCINTEKVALAGGFGAFGGNAAAFATNRSALNAIQKSRRANSGSQLTQAGSVAVSSIGSGSLSVGVTAASR